MGKSQLYLKKYKQEGHLKHEYNGLLNLVNDNNEIVDLKSKDININLEHPVDIQCQPSYDGTVNLILNDDINPPRIINSRFSVIEDNKYKIINRNQLSQTNLYSDKHIDSQSRLFKNINKIPKINLLDINNYGQLTGGNYVFYIKYADNDYNQTDIVCESGLINIFKGNVRDVSSISGTMLDELTDKVINLRISNIDTSFAKIYVYYTRYTTDLNGTPITRTFKFVKPYDIKYTHVDLSINGFEEVEEIDEEELNIKYNLVTNVKTQTQVQNMLFFGNVQGVVLNNKDLQNISYFINIDLKQKTESIGYIDEYYKPKENDDIKQTEYYNPLNTYYSLGYWPDEIYRLGIVYIMSDDSLSPVYNLRGCEFLDIYNNLSEKGRNIKTNAAYKTLYESESKTKMNYIPSDIFIDREIDLSNTKGVFKLPNNIYIQNYVNKTTNPLYFDINLSQDVKEALIELKVKGFFIVRQKRIPITLAQGLSIGVDKSSFIPMLYDNEDDSYFSESFISKESRKLSSDFGSKRISTKSKQTSGLLCLEASINKILQSNFNGLSYSLQKYNVNRLNKYKNTLRSFYIAPEHTGFKANDSYVQGSILYIPSDVPLKYANSYGFSTRAGTMEDVKQIGFFSEKNFSVNNVKLVRGVFTPFLGINKVLDNNCIYNIKIPNYSNSFKKDYFLTRANDNSQYYAITDRYELIEDLSNINAYRGDCFTNTITTRMQSNFIDSDVPVSEIIVSPSTWSDNYNGYENTTGDKWNDINRADLNSVPLGHWVTYKCLSNYNLGLRAEDKTNVEEMALMGNPRSFYPLSSMTTASSCKIPESTLLNNGYNNTVSRKRHYLVLDVPYIKDMFDNRIMFSNIQVDDDFKNAYRIFQGLSYKDIDRQYGAIVKLITWGVDLLCIFEHGIGIIPINEKALMSTNTGQSIHMYGAGVIQNQISLISPDFGSTWSDSIIRTPVGVYGVDAYAKKIWRYTKQKGFELLSDVKVQKFLNENINFTESDKYPIISLKNVKTHYNNYKGDVMFTFYNKDKEWNLCYNERMEKWITKYSWTPVYSENVNNIFYSLDNDKSQILSLIYYNKLGMNDLFMEEELNTSTGIRVKNSEWNYNGYYNSDIKLIGYDFYTKFDMEVLKISTSYLDKDDIEINEQLDNSIININNTFDLLTKNININNNILYDVNNKLKYYYIVVDVLIKPTVQIESKDSLGNVIFDENGNIITKDIIGQQFYDKFCIILNYNNLSNERTDKENSEKDKYNLLLKNGFYVHGRAGIFDEIEYNTEQISPTKWYDKQYPFEFEFVVNNLTGMHKIFNDLVIISNNVEPELFSFEIEGDVYNFNKANIYNYGGTEKEFKDSLKSQLFEKKNITNNNEIFSNKTDIIYDPILTQYSLKVTQDCKNMKTMGRLKGNIQYKEGSWYSVIEPIYYKDKFLTDGITTISDWKNTRIRDKFMKIRVKYKGDKLVIITALKTLMTLSYA